MAIQIVLNAACFAQQETIDGLKSIEYFTGHGKFGLFKRVRWGFISIETIKTNVINLYLYYK